jgi:hypothetical protein
MNPLADFQTHLTRRAFIARSTLGTAALAALLKEGGR